MFGVIVRRSLSLQRGAFTDLLFFLVLILSCRGQELIGSSQPIKALVGDDVILPCHLNPSSDAFDLTVEWARLDLDPRYVCVRRNGEEFEPKKNRWFRGRSRMFPEELRHGNISLKLSKVKLQDGGAYRCFIPSLDKYVTVQLRVVDQFFPAPPNPSPTHDPPGSPVVTISVTVCAALVLVLVPAVIFAVRKWRQNRPKTRKKDETEEEGTPETGLPEFHVEKEGEERKPLMTEREEEDVQSERGAEAQILRKGSGTERQTLREERQRDRDSQKKEHERQEETARREAAKQEAARQEAAKIQAAKQKLAEKEVRQEAFRQKAVRQEAARQNAARQEAVRQKAARQEEAKKEKAREKVAKKEQGRKAVSQEAARQEAVSQKAAKQGQISQEATKQKADSEEADSQEASVGDMSLVITAVTQRENSEGVEVEKEEKETENADVSGTNMNQTKDNGGDDDEMEIN